jgi:hypothetical protein
MDLFKRDLVEAAFDPLTKTLLAESKSGAKAQAAKLQY